MYLKHDIQMASWKIGYKSTKTSDKYGYYLLPEKYSKIRKKTPYEIYLYPDWDSWKGAFLCSKIDLINQWKSDCQKWPN